VSDIEEQFFFQCRALGLPQPEREYPFAKQKMKRNWRADFCWPDRRLLVEIEGGVWAQGRHVRGAGFEKDIEKYNAAILLGWKLLRFSSAMVKSGEAITTVEEALRTP